jgi:hypothetical protein
LRFHIRRLFVARGSSPGPVLEMFQVTYCDKNNSIFRTHVPHSPTATTRSAIIKPTSLV